MSTINYLDRVKRLRKAMKAKGLDAFIVLDRTNTRYLTGFTGSYSTTIVDGSQIRFITDSRYAEIAESKLPKGYKVICQPTSGVKDFYLSLFAKSGYKTMGFEESITFEQFETWKDLAKPTTLVGAQKLILDMRMVKDDTELAIIKKATKLADAMMALAMENLKPGITEWQLSKIIRRGSEDLGGEGESFENIVASGTNSSRPHHRGSTRKIRVGDMVTVDLGGIVDGYCSDLTRAVMVGKNNKKFEEIYNVCLAANEAAIKGIRPGMTSKEADALARDVIKSAGFGEYFGHGLGHGVGLEIHEGPRLSPEGKHILAPGHIITIEPGIYIPGFGGVRIEDYAVVTDKGVKVLSKSPKNYTVLKA